eukprot:COSAG01_NODE_454_length_16827_cov_61.424199_5_plen_73_part_00
MHPKRRGIPYLVEEVTLPLLSSANAADGSATTVEGGGQHALLQAKLRCLRSQNEGLQSRLRAMQERVDTLEA